MRWRVRSHLTQIQHAGGKPRVDSLAPARAVACEAKQWELLRVALFDLDGIDPQINGLEDVFSGGAMETPLGFSHFSTLSDPY